MVEYCFCFCVYDLLCGALAVLLALLSLRQLTVPYLFVDLDRQQLFLQLFDLPDALFPEQPDPVPGVLQRAVPLAVVPRYFGVVVP